MSDHYQTLGLQPDASKTDIRNAYFRLAHRYHPDHHAQDDAAARAAADAAFRKAHDAYEVLSDDRRRAEYDRTVRPSSSSASGNQRGQYGGGASSGYTYGSPDWEPRAEALRACQEEMSRAQSHDRDAYSSWSGYRNRQGQYSSSRGGYGPWPRPIASGTKLFMCCAAALGGSALLWSMYKRDKKAKGS
ncbi:uncharacterized protein [Lolium perenne]|uniref:uncharacterized protein n=1 Tax=Lolium perenne TaxID=4522 RepID=UPI0021EAD7E2|nr:chaperone protein dnaJ 72-like [Lolium perenne]